MRKIVTTLTALVAALAIATPALTIGSGEAACIGRYPICGGR